jgi:hypothetical protein
MLCATCRRKLPDVRPQCAKGYWKGGTRTQREPDTLHRILRTTFSGDRQCKIRLQTVARLRRDPHRSPGSPPPPSSARNTSSPGLRHEGPWPTAPSNHRRETTFSNTAGSCPESSTRRSICASTATSARTARTARNFSSTSGAAPARVARLRTLFRCDRFGTRPHHGLRYGRSKSSSDLFAALGRLERRALRRI